MSGGNPEFQQIVAQAPRKKLKILTSIITSSVATNGVANVDFYSSPGTLSRMVAFYAYILAPTGATSGTHQIELLNGTSAGHFLMGASNYQDVLFYDYSQWMVATNQQNPSTQEATIGAVNNVYFDSVTPLRIAYTNASNAANANQRIIILTVEETTLGVG